MPLKNVCNIKNMELSEKIETNLISFFDAGFLDIGAYFNIGINQSGDYSSNLSSLTKVTDNRGFTYWAGPKNWVYESGADAGLVNAPAQIYVNNNPYLLGSINYRDGYVYNIPSSGTSVKAEYSYKCINFTSANKLGGWSKKITSGTHRPDLDAAAPSGNREIQIDLPFVSFDIPPISRSKPWGLGGDLSPMTYMYKVKATVVGENSSDVKRISDIICKQQGYCINTFDPSVVSASGDRPLNVDGTLNSGKTHDQLATQYEWGKIMLNKITSENGRDLGNNLYHAIINIELEIVGCGC